MKKHLEINTLLPDSVFEKKDFFKIGREQDFEKVEIETCEAIQYIKKTMDNPQCSEESPLPR